MKTLKILIVAGLLLLPGLKLQAQHINYGVQAGYVYANAHAAKISDNSVKMFNPLHSFSINGYVEYKFSGVWGIAAEPGFIRKGGVVDGENHHLDRFDLKLNYVQLPILVNIYLNDKFFISFGPEFAYLMNQNLKLPSLPDSYTPLEKEYYKIFTPFKDNAFEVSAMIGVNYSITKKIDLGLRYSRSFTPFSETTFINHRYPIGAGIIGHSNVYNQYFQFIISYRIRTNAEN